MLTIGKATEQVKRSWVSLYGDEGFYCDEVFDVISRAHKKDPTEATYNTLRAHLTPKGYDNAVRLIKGFCERRERSKNRFRGVVPVRIN